MTVHVIVLFVLFVSLVFLFKFLQIVRISLVCIVCICKLFVCVCIVFVFYNLSEDFWLTRTRRLQRFQDWWRSTPAMESLGAAWRDPRAPFQRFGYVNRLGIWIADEHGEIPEPNLALTWPAAWLSESDDDSDFEG